MALDVRQADLEVVGTGGNGDKEILGRLRQGQVRTDGYRPVFFDGIEVRGQFARFEVYGEITAQLGIL